jgi:hypothetical protein
MRDYKAKAEEVQVSFVRSLSPSNVDVNFEHRAPAISSRQNRPDRPSRCRNGEQSSNVRSQCCQLASTIHTKVACCEPISRLHGTRLPCVSSQLIGIISPLVSFGQTDAVVQFGFRAWHSNIRVEAEAVPQHTYGGAGGNGGIAPTHSRPRH